MNLARRTLHALSLSTILYGISLLLLSTFARPAIELIRKGVATKGISEITWAIAVVGALVLLSTLRELTLRKIFSLSVLLLITAYYLSTFSIVEERLHLFKFGILSFLLCRDLREERGYGRGIALAIIFTSLVGALDETAQLFIPGRVGDIRDVLFDAVGGVWGAWIWVVVKKG